MLFPSNEIEALRAAADSGACSIASSVDPIALTRAASPLFSKAQLFLTPDGTVQAGLGVAWSDTGAGERRFDSIGEAVAEAPGGPIFCGFSFGADGPASSEWMSYPAVEAVIPQVALTRNGEASRLTLRPGPGSSIAELIELLAKLAEPGQEPFFDPGSHRVVSIPSPADWRSEVEEAIAAIAQESLSKVVLSRSVLVETEHTPNPFGMVEFLRRTYPQCYVFVWQAGGSVFFGATPELLLETEGDSVRVNPLAGSARRGEGEADDRAVGEALMHSAKDREEHALVVDDIAIRLEPFVSALSIPSRPSLRRMATVQHLSSEISGTLHSGVEAFQLVNVMHPTPAVGGTPRQAALAFVDKAEGIDRGWYTGGIGVIDADGDATFAIPLRCALVTGNRSRLYAGAGIVADSHPDGELDETRLKFRPMLNLLTAT